ncbi:MAG: chain-length determining protein [Prevotella sp.]|nr:chain-length determining protein [Prevotella sp.]
MNSEQEQTNIEPRKEKSSFRVLFRDMKKRRRLYFIVLPIAFVMAAIYAMGIPNTYKCTVKLAPEVSKGRTGGSLGGLASAFGISLGSGMSGDDAIIPSLYPELVNSVNFRTSLFSIKVHRKNGSKEMTYYDYLLHEQKSPWWSKAKKAVFTFLFGDKSDKRTNGANEVDNFQLTKEQTFIQRVIGRLIFCDVDKKTFVITISVIDQDPLIAATIADSVQQKLQRFITDYRTSKAKVDVEYYQTLFAEAKENYEKALHDYAYFSDHNQKVQLQSVRSQQTKLETELGLQQQAYSQVAAQLIAAEAKLQEERPAFTILQPATVPVQKSAPSRAKICLLWMFLAFLGTTAYIIYKEGHVKMLLGLDDDED